MNIIKSNLKFKNSLTPLDISNMKYIVIHHIQAKTATPEQIHQWHLANKWSGAGYNEYIRKDGTVYILRGDHVGAHCADSKNNYNVTGYGIACEGDYETETTMPPEQMKSLVERIKYNKARMKAAKVVQHKELTSTSCPGKNFPWNEIIKKSNENNLTVEDSIQILIDKKIISGKEYWTKTAKEVQHVDKLLINMATYIKPGR